MQNSQWSEKDPAGREPEQPPYSEDVPFQDVIFLPEEVCRSQTQFSHGGYETVWVNRWFTKVELSFGDPCLVL